MNIEKIKQKKSIKELLEFGIINIDKCSGPTSFNISDFVKKRFELRKTSHFGTLDPKVTGVLPVALNRACKLTGYFIGEDKEYVGIMRIHEEISLEKIKETIEKNFIGKIIQMPPVKSRVKRQEREREIKRFDLLEQDGKDILFHVECQGGTYIRKLISDLGDILKIGAHMLELRRVRAGIFKECDEEYPVVKLEDLEKAFEKYEKGNEEKLRKMIIPGEIVSRVYPVADIDSKVVDRVLHGCPIYHKFLKNKLEVKTGDKICVFSGEKFIGMYKVSNEKEFFANSEFVMQDIS